MILVTGATGHLGTAAIEHLVKKVSPGQVVGLARGGEKIQHLQNKGIQVRTGDYDDRGSLDKVMAGIDTVFLISTNSMHRFQQHKHVIDAAKSAGVKRLVYTSAAFKDLNSSGLRPILESHVQTEDYIKASGMGYTLLRNSMYMDMIPLYIGKAGLETGIRFPAGDGKVAYALRREMGEGAANVLYQDGHDRKTYELTGSELYSFYDVARDLSELLGKNLTYTAVDAAAFSADLTQAGAPEGTIRMLTGFGTAVKNKELDILSLDLEHLLGRKPASLKQGLKELYKL